MLLGFGKWTVSPKAVVGYVVSFVVSKCVNIHISIYLVFRSLTVFIT